ncbi:MAG: TraB/GumN family protein [Bacteroidia bacterium]|nr:TraB/GumN family protein [Bacteroidota bacterium]MBP6641288.1 TraB/GumN family protein [Bacteroidia bacterium]MBP6722365.1 TraB/GumN family protein [Bacteroidia bacterium]MBP8074360.1 TraB/GumN family protein [Bacteroidia bacterium]
MKPRFYAFALLFFPFIFPSLSQAQLEKSLLWEISGNGLATPSYLYGTMHVGDKRAHDFSDATMNAFKQAKAFAGELNMEDVDQLAVLNLMKLDSGKKLHTFFSSEEWTKIEAYFNTKLHVNPNDFDDYNTFFLYSMIAQSQFKNQKGEAVDLYFFSEAKKAGKKLLGLEKVEEQIAAIGSMPLDEQKKMILDAVEGKQGNGKKELKKMMKYYTKGDLESLLKFSEDTEMGPEFERALIIDRNHRMADRMVPLMEAQSTFVGVGALHLPGEEGVINLLRKKGYSVKALK